MDINSLYFNFIGSFFQSNKNPQSFQNTVEIVLKVPDRRLDVYYQHWFCIRYKNCLPWCLFTVRSWSSSSAMCPLKFLPCNSVIDVSMVRKWVAKRPDITVEVRVEQSEQSLLSVYACVCVCVSGLFWEVLYLPSPCNFLFAMIHIFTNDTTCYWTVKIIFNIVWCNVFSASFKKRKRLKKLM